MRKYDVISFGSALIDMFMYPDFKEKAGKIFLNSGTKIELDDVKFSTGGGAINTSICISKLGLKAAVIGKIGIGHNGKIIEDELEKENVDFLGVKSKGHTGHSVIFETDKGNRTILTYKGLSNSISIKELDLKKINSNWIHFTSMGEESFETQKKIAKFAHENGIKISFNPSTYLTSKGKEHIKEILSRSEILSLNKEEAKMLIKKGNLFIELRKLGPRIVCITDGENEGGIYDGEFLYKFWPKKVKVKEATGAGDVFVSTFLVGLIKYNDIERALKGAIANSESLVKTEGLRKGILSWKELNNEVRKGSFKIKKEVLR